MSHSLLLNGAKGRMGQAILASAKEFGMSVCAGCDVGDDPAPFVSSCDVIVDFSHHSASKTMIDLASRHNKALVIGTTGHRPEEKMHLSELARQIPCVWATNFSVGVNLLFALTRRATSVLGPDFDIEVLEMHHRFKKDAPSGTAGRLLEIILEERKLSAEALRHGRQGMPGERSASEVGVHALRGGDVVGDHTVVFAGLGERVELSHKASDRGVLARGALRAALWIVDQKPGLYDMQDVLGLK